MVLPTQLFLNLNFLVLYFYICCHFGSNPCFLTLKIVSFGVTKGDLLPNVESKDKI